MKKKKQLTIVSISIIIGLLFVYKGITAQTAGNMTFTVSLATHSAGYGSKHVSAIWIENASGAFVKTKYRMASGHTLNSHLPVWKANSNSNVVDATAGSTLTTYTPITVNWNATNVSAALVPDGDYRVFVEFTWDDGSANHDTTSVGFTKGTGVVHLSPADKTNFKSLVLDWVPSNVGIENNRTEELFSVYPNPVTSESIIKYALNDLSDVTISVYDISGKLISVLMDENQDAGDYSLNLSINGKMKPGIYFIKMYTGKKQYTRRIMITE